MLLYYLLNVITFICILSHIIYNSFHSKYNRHLFLLHEPPAHSIYIHLLPHDNHSLFPMTLYSDFYTQRQYHIRTPPQFLLFYSNLNFYVFRIFSIFIKQFTIFPCLYSYYIIICFFLKDLLQISHTNRRNSKLSRKLPAFA